MPPKIQLTAQSRWDENDSEQEDEIEINHQQAERDEAFMCNIDYLMGYKEYPGNLVEVSDDLSMESHSMVTVMKEEISVKLMFSAISSTSEME